MNRIPISWIWEEGSIVGEQWENSNILGDTGYSHRPMELVDDKSTLVAQGSCATVAVHALV